MKKTKTTNPGKAPEAIIVKSNTKGVVLKSAPKPKKSKKKKAARK